MKKRYTVVPTLFELKSKKTKQAERYGTEHPGMAKLCKVLATSTSVQEKCIHKLTCYHVAAVLMYPAYRNHPCTSQMEAEIDRLRLDLQGMISSMDGPRCLGEPVAKKPKTVMIDSDTESDDKESQNEGSAERAGNELDSCLRSTSVGWVFWSSGKNRQSFFPKLRKSHVVFTPFRRRKIKANELSAHRAMWWQTWAPHWTLNIWMSCCWSVHSTNIELAWNERFAVCWPEHSNIFTYIIDNNSLLFMIEFDYIMQNSLYHNHSYVTCTCTGKANASLRQCIYAETHNFRTLDRRRRLGSEIILFQHGTTSEMK